MNSAQSFYRAMERALARKAKQGTQIKQADYSSPAPIVIKAATSIRMTDEEYRVVMLSKMKSYIQNKLTAASNKPTNSKGNQ